MQHLFYQNHKEPNGSYTHSLKTKEIHRAMTMHPFKNHTYQYRMNHYLSKLNIYNQRHRSLLLHREINTMESILRETSTEEPNKYGLTPSLNNSSPGKGRATFLGVSYGEVRLLTLELQSQTWSGWCTQDRT